MTSAEPRYTQIEKEATWECEKLATYIQGKTITLEMDHKPLVPQALGQFTAQSCVISATAYEI